MRAQKRPGTQTALSSSEYLAVKATVDDRALNRHVIDVLRRELVSSQATRVLEVGAGIGTMVGRLADWSILSHAEYTLLDADQESLDAAPQWLTQWAASTKRSAAQRGDGSLHISGGSPAVSLSVTTARAQLGEYLGQPPRSKLFDLLVANAFLDLVDVPETLPALFARLVPHGLFWFSINFDGETIFTPEHPSDDALLGVYHQSMDERALDGKRAGDSRTGRHLFQHLTAAGARILAAGSSDWIVNAIDGKYPAREAEFVEHILHTIDLELNWRGEVDQAALREWLAVRREQLARGELVYIAHQLDILGRRS